MDEKDEIVYCGTSTGDVAKVYFGYPEDETILEPKRPPVLIGCFGKYKGKKSKSTTGSTADCYSQGKEVVRSYFYSPMVFILTGNWI